MKYLLIFSIVFLSGCASTDKKIERQLQLYNRPLFEMQCPETGCVMSSLVVHNPEQIKLQRRTNGWDFANKLVNVVTVALPEAKAAYIAGEFLKAAVNRDSSTTTNTTTTDSSVSDSNNSQAETNDTVTNNTTDSYNTSSTQASTESTETNTTDSYNSAVTTTSTDTSTEANDSYNVLGDIPSE